MIENREVAVGTRLVARYKKTDYVCVVEAAEEGKVEFVLEDGKRFKSPSSVASAVMGGQAANGWRFWSIEGAAPATTATAPRARTKADSAKTTTKPARKPKARSSAKAKLIRVMDNQEDVPEGQVRYWCAACQDAFLGFAGETPSQCPNGHRADDPEAAAILSESAVRPAGRGGGMTLVAEGFNDRLAVVAEAAWAVHATHNRFVFTPPRSDDDPSRVAWQRLNHAWQAEVRAQRERRASMI